MTHCPTPDPHGLGFVIRRVDGSKRAVKVLTTGEEVACVGEEARLWDALQRVTAEREQMAETLGLCQMALLTLRSEVGRSTPHG